MKCVFCNTDYPVGTIVCSVCNEYKGLITPEEERTLGMKEINPEVSFISNKGNTFTTLGEALDDAFALMAEAREHHLETHDSDCDCDYRAGEE